MWARLPDVLVAHVAMLAPPVLLSALSQVDKRCHASVSERITNLAALRMQPFDVCIDVILGTSDIARLGESQISDADMEVLARACASGALASLKGLYLDSNQIGDAGMQSFSTALASGAMAHLNDLYLSSNPISDESKGTMRSAMSKRSSQVYL